MSLRSLFDSQSHLGGINFCFFGDCFQIPPVCNSPCNITFITYETISHFCISVWATPKNAPSAIANAFEIWNSFNFCVILTGNHRQREDPNYLEICRQVRFGDISVENLKLLNTRVISSSPQLKPLQEDSYFRPTCIARNVDRCAINHCMTRAMCPATCTLYQFTAQSTTSNRDINKILFLDDNFTSNISMIHTIYVGMPIVLATNVGTNSNDPKNFGKIILSKGSICHIIGIRLHNHDEPGHHSYINTLYNQKIQL
jgi:hypothetical protein